MNTNDLFKAGDIIKGAIESQYSDKSLHIYVLDTPDGIEIKGLIHHTAVNDKSILDEFLTGDIVELIVIEKNRTDKKLGLAFPNNISSNGYKTLAFCKIADAEKLESKILDLSSHELTEFPKPLKRCTGFLEELNFSNNKIKGMLTSDIGLFSHIKSLDLSNNNHLNQLPQSIGLLNKLEYLNISNTAIKNLPTTLSPTQLNCIIDDKKGSPAKVIPSDKIQIGSIVQGKIKLIYNYGVFIRYENEDGYREGLLHKSLLGKNIMRLLIIGNDIEVKVVGINPEIKDISGGVIFGTTSNSTKNVAEQYLEKYISELDPNVVVELDLSGYDISKLPINISRLKNLRRLDLRDNNIKITKTFIEYLMKAFNQLQIISSDDIPPEVSARGINFILEYVDKKTVKKNLKEAKMLIVGEAEVGKTSTIKRLFFNEFNQNNQITDGLDIIKQKIPIDGQDVYLNIWDFGGQEIYHSTHQFFLTKRSLYLLVWDARKGKEHGKLEHWLKLIQSFGGDSPVIIVMNRVDEYVDEIDKEAFKNKYPQIRAFHEISCKTGYGIDDGEKSLKKSIQEHVGKLEHLNTSWDESWFNVKTELEKMDTNFCDFDKYTSICKSHGIEDEVKQIELIRFLHDLGVVLNFQDNPILKDTNVLKPHWVTEAVYKIILSLKKEKKQGIFRYSYLSEVLDKIEYPQNKHYLLISLMQKFELCYQSDTNSNDIEYVMPDSLSEARPLLNWTEQDEEDCISFRYDYTFLPDSILSRFIVRVKPYIMREKKSSDVKNTNLDFTLPSITISGDYNYILWKNGVMLEYKESKALIIADKEERNILINVMGLDSTTKRNFLTKITHNFEYIHSTIQKIEVKEIIPLKKEKLGSEINYAFLEKLESEGDKTIRDETTMEKLNVSEVLDTVRLNSRLNTKDVLKFFISYSHEDTPNFMVFKRELEDLRIDFGYEKIKIYEDTQLVVGESWDEELKKELNECHICIFLLSRPFLNSDYIKRVEFQILLDRKKEEKVILFPILFRPCNFSSWEALKTIQVHKPSGNEYGVYKKDFSYCDLIPPRQINEPVMTNTNRDSYMTHLTEKLLRSLTKIGL